MKLIFLIFIFSIFSSAEYMKIETFLTEKFDKKYSKVLSINENNISSNNILVLNTDVSKLFESCFFKKDYSILCNITKVENEKTN